MEIETIYRVNGIHFSTLREAEAYKRREDLAYTIAALLECCSDEAINFNTRMLEDKAQALAALFREMHEGACGIRP